MADKIGVWNQGPINNQTNNVTINYGQEKNLSHSDPLPDRSHFQGRVPEQAELHGWLDDRAVSMIGVKGEGGIGKSTLTAKVFADCVGFGGKCWVDVRSGTTLSGVARSALQEFGVPTEQVIQIEEQDLPRRLLRQMQMARCLLAIDNLESVLGGDGVWQSGYEEFLDEFEGLGGESVILLAGREYPERYRGWRKSRWLAVETGLEPGEGAALLGALEAEGTEDERSTISVRVEGNPLALALLAGWLREEYRGGKRSVAHLEKRPDLFELKGKHRGDRLSLADVFDWSFDRLTPTAQELLTQVSVLRGGFNHEAAGALVQREVTDRELQDLERRSLLQELPGRDRRGQLGYRLQPRVQDFAQKLGGDLTQAHERAIQHFLSQIQTEFAPTDTEEAAHEYLETYYHLCHLGHHELATQTVFCCDEFLSARGYAIRLVDLYAFLNTVWQPASGEESDYAQLCNNLGDSYRYIGQYERAIKFLKQALDIRREIDCQAGEAASLSNLGISYHSLGQYQLAIEFQQQALDIRQEIGDRSGEANSLGNLGCTHQCLGQYQLAIEFQQQALDIRQEIGDRSGEANSLSNLSHSYNSLGQYQNAIEACDQSLIIAWEVGNKHNEMLALGGLGSAYCSKGDYERGIDFEKQSLKVAQEVGDKGGEANSLDSLGHVYNSLKEYKRAIEFYEQSLKIKREIGNRRGEAYPLRGLACAHNSLGQYERAINFHQQHCDIAREIGDRREEADSLIRLGCAYGSLNKYEQSIDLLQQSLIIKREIGDQRGECYSLWNLAVTYRKVGRIREYWMAEIQFAKILEELDLSLEDPLYPNWMRRLLNLWGRGKGYQVACFVAGLVAFPFMLILLPFMLTLFVLLTAWRLVAGQFRQRKK